jgi:hypothetical protein
MKKITENPYKKAEFEAFLETLRGNTTAHWIQIAEVLGVDKDTITQWKRHPKAQEALREGVARAMEGMEKAGKKDWRMWESKVKMLGISPVDKQDITTDGKKIKPLLGGISEDDSNNRNGETRKAKKKD